MRSGSPPDARTRHNTEFRRRSEENTIERPSAVQVTASAFRLSDVSRVGGPPCAGADVHVVHAARDGTQECERLSVGREGRAQVADDLVGRHGHDGPGSILDPYQHDMERLLGLRFIGHRQVFAVRRPIEIASHGFDADRVHIRHFAVYAAGHAGYEYRGLVTARYAARRSASRRATTRGSDRLPGLW